MHRKFIAAVAAASIVITTIGAAPARAADNDDIARALAVILGLAVIGSALRDRDDHRRPVYRTVPKRHPHAHRPQNRYPYAHPHGHRHGPKAKPLPHRVNRKLLPPQCLRSFRTDRGHARIFVQRCLERSYQFTNRLPQECARRVWTDRGVRHGYGARCLNRRGYALARR